jgi:hypothetical protein
MVPFGGFIQSGDGDGDGRECPTSDNKPSIFNLTHYCYCKRTGTVKRTQSPYNYSYTMHS